MIEENNRLDPKLVEEFLKFGKNMIEAPKLVPALDEINLEVTEHEVAYTEDKVRLLHYKPRTSTQIKTPLIIAYALINRYHILDIHPQKSWVRNLLDQGIDGWRETTVVRNLAKHIDVDKMVDSIGNMPPEFMYYCFSILKPFEQGIEKYTNFFRNIENESYVDNFLRVEKWLGDTPPIPGELFKQWIRDIYQDNLLIQDKMYVGGKHISLKNITMPIFTQVAIGDHLVSPECSMPLHYAVGSEDKTLRVYPTGHVGMIASSLSQKKVLPELGQWLKEHSELR